MLKFLSAALLLSLFSANPGSAQQCDFLAPDYFSRPEVISDSSLCLQQGYTFAIQTRETHETPLHLAVQEVDDPLYFDQLAILIPEDQRQNLVNVPNANDLNPFQLAVSLNRDPKIIVRLSKWGDVVNSMNEAESRLLVLKRGTTGLHLAVKPEAGVDPSIDMIMTLLAIGADPDLEDVAGNKPFYYAQEASNLLDVALLLDAEFWRTSVLNTFGSLEALEGNKESISAPVACKEFLSTEFFEASSPSLIRECTVAAVRSQPDPRTFWSLRDSKGDNALHLALKADINRDKLNSLLAAAEVTEGLEFALSSLDLDGMSPIHIAAKYSSDPLILVSLARWGSDVDAIANALSNGFLKVKTGTTALHLAAKREDSEYFVTALLAVGATPFVYDNNTKENQLGEAIGLTPIDYLSRSHSLNTMALIAPKFSVCEAVSDNTEKFAAVLGLGAGATGTAALATSGLGITAVTHSSGAVILTGSSGYIAGTLGTVGSSALAFLTAPITITAAAVSVIAVGGTVYYCSSES